MSFAQAAGNVTFSVDMNSYGGSFTTVYVSGAFNSWSGVSNPLVDMGGGIWSGVIAMPAGLQEYKFTMDDWALQEALTPNTICSITTGGLTNRLVYVDGDETLSTPCFDSCDACGAAAPAGGDITVTVDMSTSGETFTSMYLVGSFNGWVGTANIMADNGDGTWSTTATMPGGAQEFKFAFDDWAGSETLIWYDACYANNEGNTNRQVYVDGNADLGTFCYGSCGACVVGGGGLPTLTFDDAASITPWAGVGDGTNPEASIAWNAAGNGTGAMALTGVNPDAAIGKAYTFEYASTGHDFSGSTSYTLSFDLKSEPGFVGSAVHSQITLPGAGAVNNFDLQTGGLNDATWTSYSYEISGVDNSSDALNMHFNMAAGAFVGAGGTLLVDNVVLAVSVAVPGCMDVNATNYNAAATIDDGSCTYPAITLTGEDCDDDATEMRITGPFWGWNPTGGPVAVSNGDGTWTVTLDPGPSTDMEYLWVKDGVQENLLDNVPQDLGCTPITDGAAYANRLWVIGSGNVTGDVYDLCTNCDGTGGLTPLTLTVDACDATPAEVRITGPFWGWDTAGGPVATDNGDGTWTVTLDPAPVADMEYLWVMDGVQENLLDNAPQDLTCTPITDGAAYANRLWTVGSADVTGDVYDSCTACPVDAADVTFQVDMNDYAGGEVISYINVSGDWNGWCGDCNQLTDADLDGVWTGTISVPSGDSYFKYTINNWADEEALAGAGSCVETNGSFTNRTLSVDAGVAQSLDVVCFTSCYACATGETPGCTNVNGSNYDALATVNDGSCLFDVTFQLNTLTSGVDFTGGAHLFGSFNGWCGGCAAMTDDGGGLWSLTVELAEGQYEYKYSNDAGNTVAEDVAGIGGCVVENFGFWNRSVQVTDDMTLDVVCWEGCSDCVPGEGCTDATANNYDAAAVVDNGSCLYDVIFTVDMNQYGTAGVDYTTPEVNGVFNAWCGGCAPMADPELDGVWTVTIELGVGTYQYQFAIDSWTDQEFGLDPAAACTIGANRFVDVTGVTDIGQVCWESCGACVAPVFVDVTFRVDMSNETLSPNGVHIAGAFQGWDAAANEMTHLGFGIYETTVNVSGNQSYQYKYINGNAFGSDEVIPPSCNVDNNRQVAIGDVDMVVDLVCFAQCEACAGCTDPFSVEYNPFAGSDDGSCATAIVFGCTYVDAENYMAAANSDDGSCTFAPVVNDCPEDQDGDGAIGTSDLLAVLAAFGSDCP